MTRKLYSIILTENANEDGQFVRNFNFYQGDLLFHFMNFNHCEDFRFCEIPKKRRQAVFCGMQWIDDKNFPIKYPFKMINGNYLNRNPVCSIIKEDSRKLKKMLDFNEITSVINFPVHHQQKTDPYYLKNKEKKKLTVYPIKPIRTMVYERDNFTCVCCGEKTFSLLTLDHIIPKSKGGDYTLDNLQTLCKRCNCAKSNLIISIKNLQKLINL